MKAKLRDYVNLGPFWVFVIGLLFIVFMAVYTHCK